MNEIDIEMTKKRSPHIVRITTDKEDPFFCNITLLKAKTGQVACSHYILTSDVEQWQRQFEAEGFIARTNDLQQKNGI